MIEKDQFFVIDRPSMQPFFDELYNWHWKDLKPQQDEDQNMPEIPVDKDNHAMEAAYNYAIMIGKSAELPENPETSFLQKRLKWLYKGKKETSWLR